MGSQRVRYDRVTKHSTAQGTVNEGVSSKPRLAMVWRVNTERQKPEQGDPQEEVTALVQVNDYVGALKKWCEKQEWNKKEVNKV